MDRKPGGKQWKTGYINQSTYNNNQNNRATDNTPNKAVADTTPSGMAEVKARPVTGSNSKSVGTGRLYNKELKNYVMLNPDADICGENNQTS